MILFPLYKIIFCFYFFIKLEQSLVLEEELELVLVLELGIVVQIPFFLLENLSYSYLGFYLYLLILPIF